MFFERLAETQPVLLLIEDAQYADEGLLDFMDHLVDWARDSPIFVVVFTRPELDSTRPGFGSGRNRSSLTLDPLDETSMAALTDALVPDMPEAARAAILSQAEGIPLFAVETVRSLVDRDIVVPRDGVYRLVGDLGELTVPDGLRALLAARLDALDSNLRSLVSEAAVLGSTFPADSLMAVSAQDATSVRAGLAELLRREVLSISADRLSPQRGDYRFSQDLLRQVAYDTMSRRDRKTRHLTVAAHLRSVFRADGDEVAEVISRHYLDALAAVPDAPDVGEIRAQAITMLVRAGDRALRAGAGWSAASNYASAAQQTELGEGGSDDDVVLSAAGLWERAARAALIAFDVDGTLAHSRRASGLYAAQGQARAAARADAIAGDALRRSGRHGEARETLTAALVVLRPDPDSDTVTALDHLAAVEIFSGGQDGDRLSAEALALGQALDVDAGLLADLFTDRGIALGFAESNGRSRRPPQVRRQAGRRGRRHRPAGPRPRSIWPRCSTRTIQSVPQRRPACPRHSPGTAAASISSTTRSATKRRHCSLPGSGTTCIGSCTRRSTPTSWPILESEVLLRHFSPHCAVIWPTPPPTPNCPGCAPARTRRTYPVPPSVMPSSLRPRTDTPTAWITPGLSWPTPRPSASGLPLSGGHGHWRPAAPTTSAPSIR